VPTGMSKIEQISAAAAKKQAAFDQGASKDFHRSLVLRPGQTATGRLCEDRDDIWFVHTHRLPPKPGMQYGDKILCVDQPLSSLENQSYQDGSRPCYACGLEGVSRSTTVIVNFIRYDDPILERDSDGKAVKNGKDYVFKKNEDGTVATEMSMLLWIAPQITGSRLAYLEMQHGGLSKHVITIGRTPDNKNPFMVDIFEKGKEPSPEEHALFDKKGDPPQVVQQLGRYKSLPLMGYEDMRRAFSGVSVPSGFAQPSAPAGNVYADAANQQTGSINRGAFS
jgi:hypothetical protein